MFYSKPHSIQHPIHQVGLQESPDFPTGFSIFLPSRVFPNHLPWISTLSWTTLSLFWAKLTLRLRPKPFYSALVNQQPVRRRCVRGVRPAFSVSLPSVGGSAIIIPSPATHEGRTHHILLRYPPLLSEPFYRAEVRLLFEQREEEGTGRIVAARDGVPHVISWLLGGEWV